MSQGALPLEDGSVDNAGVKCLQESLSAIPINMVEFSMSMRALYNKQNVTALDEKTKEFREVRDNTRRNAVVYTEGVLPMCEKLVTSIGNFTDFFEHLEFDDWKDCIDDQIQELEQCVEKCKLLKQMHSEIIVSLKKDEDKAEMGIENMELLIRDYMEQARVNEERANDCKEIASAKYMLAAGAFLLAAIAAVPTGGATVAAAGGWGTVTSIVAGAGAFDTVGLKVVSKAISYQATANKENAQIARQAINITREMLIPAMKKFLNGVTAIQGFFIDSRDQLKKMRTTAGREKKRPFFLMFKAIASQTNASCKNFQRMAEVMKTDMACIPAEAGDKNHVDLWLERMLQSETTEVDLDWIVYM